MKNSCSDAEMADSPEESSWTFYIQGFMCDQNNKNDDDEQNFSYSSEYESPSLVSDAASSPVKKSKNGLGSSGYKSNDRMMIGKQNSFKKQIRNTVMPVMDLDLEDTASSPVNSPRESHMNEFMNQKEKGKMDVAEVKRNIFAKGGVVNNNVERETVYTDGIKKRTFV